MQYQYQQQKFLNGFCNINTNVNKQNTVVAIPISISTSKTIFLQYQYHLNMGKFYNNATSITISPSVTVLSHSPGALQCKNVIQQCSQFRKSAKNHHFLRYALGLTKFTKASEDFNFGVSGTKLNGRRLTKNSGTKN